MIKHFVYTFIFFFIGSSFLYGQIIDKQIIVQLDEMHTLRAIPSNTLEDLDISIEKQLSKHANIWLLELKAVEIKREQAIKELSKLEFIKHAQANHRVEMRNWPMDPLFEEQWFHQQINSLEAWDITTGGTTPGGHEIVVALIEGADLQNHEDLQENQWKNEAEIPDNDLDDDGNGYIDDYNGWNVYTQTDDIGTNAHGTRVAGLIGARGNNQKGVVGINWNVKIMSIAGHNLDFSEASIIEAYEYALQARLKWNETQGQEGAFVVATNLSWGIDGGQAEDFPIWCDFYNILGKAGILNFGAVTNQAVDIDIVGDMPGSCDSPYLITVSASNKKDKIENAGYGLLHVDIVAPGRDVLTTSSDNSYQPVSGTSFATPLVSGLAALLYSTPCENIDELAMQHPQAMAELVKESILAGGDIKNHLLTRVNSGSRINARQTIDVFMNELCEACLPPTQIEFSLINSHSASITFEGNADEYLFYYKKEGDEFWEEVELTEENYLLEHLLACTRYEFYVKSKCLTTKAQKSDTYTFEIEGCNPLQNSSNCGIDLSPLVTQPLCEQAKNGEIQLISSDTDFDNYTFLWNTGENTTHIQNLGAANYYVHITNLEACDTLVYFELNYQLKPEVNVELTMPSCHNLSDGMIEIAVIDENTTYSYEWTIGENTAILSNLGIGFYSVNITDEDGCMTQREFTLSAPETPEPVPSFSSSSNYLVTEFHNTSEHAHSYIWQFNDGNMSTEENPTHTFQTPGNHQVCLTAIGDCDTVSMCKNVYVISDPSNIVEETFLPFEVYPNPVKEQFFIRLDTNLEVEISILDNQGRIVYLGIIHSGINTITIDKWSTGIYQLQLFDKERGLVGRKKMVLID